MLSKLFKFLRTSKEEQIEMMRARRKERRKHRKEMKREKHLMENQKKSA